MKSLFVLSLFALSTLAFGAADWKVVAETTDCGEKVQILGKEGEKFVKAVRGSTESKLVAKDGSVFSHKTMKTTEFSGSDMTYTQPGYVEANPAKIDFKDSGNTKRCSMNTK
ncbi:MAG TPA: hypothetical protein VNJ01_11390 [Bacteriovoracaceae bacterium]|nr:hypothetical protein [Bacteriovoracaceae bacterium]